MRILRYDKAVRTKMNSYIADKINPYVPAKSGNLRDSMIVTERGITWGRGLPYTHYQYEGIVYGVNKAKIRGEGEGAHIVGWYSIKGVRKQPTNRMLGTPGELMGWKFGYTDPKSRSHWTRVYTDAYSPVRREVNLKITKYLKDVCRARGLNT